MYKQINDLVIPRNHFNTIVKLFRSTGNHNLVHISGKSAEMKEACGEIPYYEAGNGEFSVSLDSEIPDKSCLLYIDPSNEFMADARSTKQIRNMPLGSHIIVVMQDVHLTHKPIPYDDSTLGFQGCLRNDYILIDNKSMRYQNNKYGEHNHLYTAYLLQRMDIPKQKVRRPGEPSLISDEFEGNSYSNTVDYDTNINEAYVPRVRTVRKLDRNDNIVYKSGEESKVLEYANGPENRIENIRINYKQTKNSPYWQHPVDGIRRFPLLMPAIRREPMHGEKRKYTSPLADDLNYGNINSIRRMTDGSLEETVTVAEIESSVTGRSIGTKRN
jgi:hypothetical protein